MRHGHERDARSARRRAEQILECAQPPVDAAVHRAVHPRRRDIMARRRLIGDDVAAVPDHQPPQPLPREAPAVTVDEGVLVALGDRRPPDDDGIDVHTRKARLDRPSDAPHEAFGPVAALGADAVDHGERDAAADHGYIILR